MNTFMNSLFMLLLGWVRTLANQIWLMFTSDRKTFLELLGEYWVPIASVLLAFGILMDALANRIRAQRGTTRKKKRMVQATATEPGVSVPAQEDWLPEQPVMTLADEQNAMKKAESVPDAELGNYPGRRYEESLEGGTHKYDVIGKDSGSVPEEKPKRRRRGDAAGDIIYG